MISGHDLKDLKLLLEQTQGKASISIPRRNAARSRLPKLKKYAHLKGNFGTRGRTSRRIREHPRAGAVPPPTASCREDSYRDRVFTTEVVAYPGMVHIGEDRISRPLSKRHWNWAATPRIRNSPASTAANRS